MQIDLISYEIGRYRAAWIAWERYQVNRYELYLLVALAGYLAHKGAVIVSKVEFFHKYTKNSKEWPKMQGYYTGLLRKGLVGSYEYVCQPGGESVGISELGVKVLKDYFENVERMQEHFKASSKRVELISAAKETDKHKIRVANY